MKKSEKNALKNAFGIPEPRHKDEFIAEYKRRLESRRRSPVPVFIRYAAVAAFALIIISIGIMHLPSPDKEFTGSDVITEVTTAVNGTEPPRTTSDGMAVTITTGDTEICGTTEPAETTETGEKTTDNTTITTDSKTVTTQAGTTSNKVTTSGTSASGTASRTTTTKRTTASGTAITTRTTTAQTTTVTAPEKDNVEETGPLTSTPPTEDTTTQPVPSTGTFAPRDYTVKPTVVYYPYDPPKSDNTVMPFDPGVEPNTATPGASSDTIVYGTVIRMYYTSFGDHTYTQIDIQIINPIRSNYLYNSDCITVYIPGGFRTDGYGGFVKNTSEFSPETYNNYLLMLNTADSRFPSGTFILSDPAEQSAFTDEGSSYVSAVDSSIRYSHYTMNQFIY